MALDQALLDQITQELKTDEGERFSPYDDATGHAPILAQWRDGKFLPSTRHDGSPGKLTVGYGWNLSDCELPIEIIERLLHISIDGAYSTALRIFPEFDDFTQNRRAALLGMIFNMGETRFRTFDQTIPLIRSGKWSEAAAHIKASAWALQVQLERRDRVLKQIQNG